MQTGHEQKWSWWFLAAVGLACVFQGYTALEWMGGPAAFASALPYLTHDHPLHYSNARITVDFLLGSGSNAGYDPRFMAGYAKSAAWPTNVLLEVVALVFSGLFGIRLALVYKAYAIGVTALLPACVAAAARVLRVPRASAGLAAWIWCWYFWQGWPKHYLMYGMVGFMASVGLGVLAGATLARFCEQPGRKLAIAAGGMLALATMAHPTAVVVLVPPALAMWCIHGSAWQGRANLLGLLAAVIAIGVNFFWLYPLWSLRGTMATGPGFFVNPNLAERLLQLANPLSDDGPWPAAERALLWLGVLGLLARDPQPGRRAALAMNLAWMFMLAYPAAAISNAGFLQLGRNTFHFFTWLCLPASLALFHPRRWIRWTAIGLALLAGTINIAHLYSTIAGIHLRGERASTAHLPASHEGLVRVLRQQAKPGSRIFFEVFEGGLPGGVGRALFGDIRMSALLPELAGVEAIGGPYLQTHYAANFAQVGDGKFFGDGDWSPERVQRLARDYGVDWLAAWSPPARRLIRQHPEVFETVADNGTFVIARIKRPRADWELRGVSMDAAPSRLTARVPPGKSGPLVLPYHWSPGWRALGGTEITATRQGDDPVPFLTLVDPPPEETLQFSPWFW